MTPNTASHEVEGTDSVERWQVYLRSVLHPSVEVIADDTLRARAVCHTYGDIQCLELTATPHTLRLSSTPAADTIARVIAPCRGEAQVIQDLHETPLPAHTFCVINGDATTLGMPARAILLQMPAKPLRDHLPTWETLLACPMPALGTTAGTSAVFIQFLRSICRHSESMKDESRREIADTLQRLLICALRAAPSCHEVLPSQIELYHKERIRNFVKAQLRDPNLSVEMIAQAIGLSSRYVYKLFSNEQTPLMRSVWDERLDHCQRDLGLAALRNRSVSEIAFFWGFNNPAHFSRAFRLRFGMSPTECRQRALHVPNAGLSPRLLNRRDTEHFKSL